MAEGSSAIDSLGGPFVAEGAARAGPAGARKKSCAPPEPGALRLADEVVQLSLRQTPALVAQDNHAGYASGVGSAAFELELVPSPGSGERATEQQTIDLARELKSIRGVDVDRAHAEAPDDTKGLDVAAIGALVGAVSPVAGAVAALVGALRSWLTRDEGRKIRVRLGERELELTGASRDQERELIELFTKTVESG